mgnify:CR=1 FL=1
MVGWTSESCRSESCTDRTAAYTISSYKPILERLTNGASAAYLGILGQDVSRAMQGSGIPAGVYVTEAVSGSPAYDAGIQPGDIIVKFGTKEIGSFKDLQAQIENSASGVSVSVNVMRKGRDGYTEFHFGISARQIEIQEDIGRMRYIEQFREGMRVSDVYLCKTKQHAVTKKRKRDTLPCCFRIKQAR